MMADELKATALFETLLLLQIKRLALSEGYCDASRFILVNLAEQIIHLEVLNCSDSDEQEGHKEPRGHN